jgi:NADH-quinone oxidoreductase subunit C
MSDTPDTPDATADAPAPEPPPTLHGHPIIEVGGQRVVHVARDAYPALARTLLDEGYEMLIDLCAVDYLTHPGRTLPADVAPERFEVVVNLLSFRDRSRLRLRVQVPEGDATLASIFDMYPGAEAMEREAFDLVGVAFIDHPDMTRILMPEDWEGHPLRKDYGVGRIPVQFKGAPT